MDWKYFSHGRGKKSSLIKIMHASWIVAIRQSLSQLQYKSNGNGSSNNKKRKKNKKRTSKCIFFLWMIDWLIFRKWIILSLTRLRIWNTYFISDAIHLVSIYAIYVPTFLNSGRFIFSSYLTYLFGWSNILFLHRNLKLNTFNMQQRISIISWGRRINHSKSLSK